MIFVLRVLSEELCSRTMVKLNDDVSRKKHGQEDPVCEGEQVLSVC